MPLFCNLSVNSQEILELKITRLDRTPLSDVKSSDVFKYKVAYATDELEEGKYKYQEIGRFEHRYGDGAKVLAQKALGLAIEKLGH